MLSAIALLTLLTAEALASPRVVPMKLQSRQKTSPSSMQKRSFTASLQNYLPGLEYFVAVTVGTPPQDLELIVDTGSSDIWMFAPDVCKTTKTYGPCLGGTFDTSSSSTYTLLSSDSFQISYADGSGVAGNYIKDTFRIGGQNITGQQMGLATSDSSNTKVLFFPSASPILTSNTVPASWALASIRASRSATARQLTRIFPT